MKNDLSVAYMIHKREFRLLRKYETVDIRMKGLFPLRSSGYERQAERQVNPKL